MLDELPFGVAVLDGEGYCIRANDALEAMAPLGGSLVGRSLAEVLTTCFRPDGTHEVLGEFLAWLQGAERPGRRELHTSDGRAFDCFPHPCSAEGAAAVLGFAEVTPHVRQREALEERVRQAGVLTDIETTLGYTTAFDDVLAALVDRAPDGAGCHSAAALSRTGDGWTMRHVRGLPRGLVGVAFDASGLPGCEEALARRRPARVRRYGDESWAAGDVLTVPLAASGEIEALLVLLGRDGAFSDAAVEFADKLATISSLALENARLQAAERETREALQTALLGVVREVEGVRFGHLYRSATRFAAVGGDFYELFKLGDGRVGVLMGDVSGKGLPAASLAALVKTTVKIHARDVGSPAGVLARTNEVLVEECGSASFVTAVYVVLDLCTGALRYCSAGHPPAVLRRADGTTMALEESSPLLGAYAGLQYEDHATTLDNGDVLLLYTDGVTEARRAGVQYGTERLVSFVAGLGAVDPLELPEIVFEEVFAHVRGDLSDDMAVVALSPTGIDEAQVQQRLPL